MVDLDPQGKQFQVGCIQSYATILDLNFPPFNLFFLFVFQVFFFYNFFQCHGIHHHENPPFGQEYVCHFFQQPSKQIFFWGGTLRVKDEEDVQPEGKTPQPQQ